MPRHIGQNPDCFPESTSGSRLSDHGAMSPLVVSVCVALAGAVIGIIVVVRRGLHYRSTRFLEWRKARSRRDRGKRHSGGPNDPGGTDPTAGASY